MVSLVEKCINNMDPLTKATCSVFGNSGTEDRDMPA
jgi:hypothetical protein